MARKRKADGAGEKARKTVADVLSTSQINLRQRRRNLEMVALRWWRWLVIWLAVSLLAVGLWGLVR